MKQPPQDCAAGVEDDSNAAAVVARSAGGAVAVHRVSIKETTDCKKQLKQHYPAEHHSPLRAESSRQVR